MTKALEAKLVNHYKVPLGIAKKLIEADLGTPAKIRSSTDVALRKHMKKSELDALRAGKLKKKK